MQLETVSALWPKRGMAIDYESDNTIIVDSGAADNVVLVRYGSKTSRADTASALGHDEHARPERVQRAD